MGKTRVLLPFGLLLATAYLQRIADLDRAGPRLNAVTELKAGPMTRTVRDAAIMPTTIAGFDERDAATEEIPRGLLMDLAEPPKPGALRGKRIGVVHGPFGFHAGMEPALAKLIAALRAVGAEVVDPARISSLGRFGSVTGDVRSFEFKDGLNRYLAEPGRVTPMKTLADLTAFNEAHAAEEMPYFGREDFTAAQARGPLPDQAYLEARAKCLRLPGPRDSMSRSTRTNSIRS